MSMKRFCLIVIAIFALKLNAANAQVALPHGMVFGSKIDTANAIEASRLKEYMDVRKRITVAVKAKVVKVNKEKGGWFELDAGDGKILRAHFVKYDVKLPAQIVGRTVIASGVAARQFVADDKQHFAGDTTTYKVNGKAAEVIDLEVKGLMVYQ